MQVSVPVPVQMQMQMQMPIRTWVLVPLNRLKEMHMILFFYLVIKQKHPIELMFCISIDPNKEGQNVFNIIPQQDLYDPWGRPGAGAPLIHAPTGQKFTRYSGSLQDKLVFIFLRKISIF
jgi:hypothetical protein